MSHDADGDVELYLRDGFGRIREQYGIPLAVSWPSKDDVREIVRRSEGLFIYPASVVRFVGEGGPLGPVEQLKLVLRLPSELSGNPWSHLDAFYTLIMKGIPNDMLTNTLKILSLACVNNHGLYYERAAHIHRLSLPTFCAALSKLHSVAKLASNEDGSPERLEFYHASFTDYLKNPERSGDFSVKGPEVCSVLLADVLRYFSMRSTHCAYIFSVISCAGE